jgi:hypothetical protein
VDIPFLALWFVCGLGTAVLAAVGPQTRMGAIAGIAGFVAGVWWSQQVFAPSTPAVAIGAGLAAALELFRPGRRSFTLAVAGLLAGLWSAVLHLQGLPVIPAVLVAVTLPTASAYLRVYRPAFAPATLREEALLFLLILGVVAAAAPGIVDGWHAAVTLNIQGSESEASPTTVMPMWTMFVASAALVSGGLFSMWSRR